MGRQATGREYLDKALEQRQRATDARELRILQAVILVLQGKTTAQTAEIVGRSTAWVTHVRRQYITNNGVIPQRRKGYRNRAFQSVAEEAAFLAPYLERARKGGILVVGEIHGALEAHLGHKVCLSSVYNLLHRHGWRKLAPDKQHVQADARVQEAWKKNCPASSGRCARNGREKALCG